MKSEVAFFRDKRGRISAANLLKFYRDLGYTDEQILVEMKKILASRNQSTHSPTEQQTGIDADDPTTENIQRVRESSVSRLKFSRCWSKTGTR